MQREQKINRPKNKHAGNDEGLSRMKNLTKNQGMLYMIIETRRLKTAEMVSLLGMFSSGAWLVETARYFSDDIWQWYRHTHSGFCIL